MNKDYYKILGVDKNASADEIKKAFRKLAHQHHPDKQGGDELKFKEANEAYSVLSDAQKRAQYDQFGSAAFNGGGGQGYGQGGFSGFEGFDFSGFGFGAQNGQGQGGQQGGFEFDLGDIFGGMFGGGGRGRGGRGRTPRGSDIQVDIELSFKDAVFGIDREIHITKNSLCEHCKGNRAEPGTEMNTCGTCHGEGHVMKQQRTILGTIENPVVCDQCAGTGKIPKTKCKVCKGKGVEHKKSAINIIIPAGIENGETLRVKSSGEALIGGENGDLYIKIYVKKDPTFKKQGYDLFADLPISIPDAVLGGEAKFESLDETFTVKIPEGIEHGEILRIKNKGVPHGNGYLQGKHISRGDLMLKIMVKIPHKLNKEQRKLFEQLRASE